MSSVLYDVPGPKARRVSLIGSIVGVVAIAGLLWWAVSILAQQGIFEPERWAVFQIPEVWVLIGNGIVATLSAAARRRRHRVPAGARAVPHAHLRRRLDPHPDPDRAGIPARHARGPDDVLRAAGVRDRSFAAVVAGLVLYNSAIFAEIIRAGIQSLPKGQREAGLAIGLTSFASRRNIELPQAIRRMLPSLVAQLVVLLKDTSLGYIVSYEELLRKVQIMADFLGPDYLFPVFFVAAAIYIAINFSVSRLAIWIEKRGSKKAAGGVVHVPVAGIPVK